MIPHPFDDRPSGWMEDASLPKTLGVGCLLWMLLAVVAVVGLAIAMSFLAWLTGGGY